MDADGAGTGLPTTTYTVYDGQHAWADFDGVGLVTARYLFGDQVDEILARWQPTEGTGWYLTDPSCTNRKPTLDVLDVSEEQSKNSLISGFSLNKGELLTADSCCRNCQIVAPAHADSAALR